MGKLKSKVYFSFPQDPDGPIPDPAGHDQLVYDALADKMEHLIAQRLETIIQKAGNP